MKKKRRLALWEWITTGRLALILALGGIAILIGGSAGQAGHLDLAVLWQAAYGSLGVGLIEVALAVLLIDRLSRQREDRSDLRRLIREMSSRDNSTAIRAVSELNARGALTDGTLAGADLKYANLDGAIMAEADLQGAYLSFAKLAGADLRGADLQGAILRAADLTAALLVNANLDGVKLLDANLQAANLHSATLRGANLAGADLTEARGLTDEKLAQAESLARAIMPTGARYDGRYNLPTDIQGVNPHDVKAMAAHYDITQAAYRRGQQWAAQTLTRLRREKDEAPSQGP